MTYKMIQLQPSKLLTAALALCTLTTNTFAKKDPLASPPIKHEPSEEEYTPIDYNDLISEEETTITTTTTSSSRAAQWGTMATTTTTTTTTTSTTLTPTSSPTTLTPTSSPTTLAPTLPPSPRPLLKSDILPLCQPALSIAPTFDTDNSTALNPHEFSSFIESISGDRAASILLSSAADDLYSQLRKACVTVFKMPGGCADETSTKDDDDDVTDYIVDQGKFDKLESEFVFDGVLLVGFDKGWEEKRKEERKYEEFFCDKVLTFLVKYGVEMEWSLIDGPLLVDNGNGTDVNVTDVVVVVDEEEEVESVENGTDVNNGTLSDLNGTVDWSNFAEIVTEETSSNLTTSTTTAATESAIITTTPSLSMEETESTDTASEINAADASLIQSINTAQTSSENSVNNGMPLGGWIGIGLGGVLFVFVVAAFITKKRRSTSNTTSNNNNNNSNNDQDDGSIWSENSNNNNLMMTKGAGSPLAAIGMASTVATRLTTGDTEVTLMKRQLWTEREPVV